MEAKFINKGKFLPCLSLEKFISEPRKQTYLGAARFQKKKSNKKNDSDAAFLIVQEEESPKYLNLAIFFSR